MNIFEQVRAILTLHDFDRSTAPEVLTADCSRFVMPPNMTLQQKEVLAAAARAVDPSISVLDATTHNTLDFKHPYEKLPTKQLLKKLEEIQAEVKRSIKPNNDGGLEFLQNPQKLPLVELEYVLRAALPYPTPIYMQYSLPAGKTYYNYDQPVQGTVDLPMLCWLKDHADNNMQYDITAELCALRAERMVVRAEDLAKLSEVLGLDTHTRGASPAA